MVEMLQKLGLPREIGVAPLTETADRKLAVQTHTPHIVGNAASEPLDASGVFTPQPKCFPSHQRVY
jgi:hypothetical protein